MAESYNFYEDTFGKPPLAVAPPLGVSALELEPEPEPAFEPQKAGNFYEDTFGKPEIEAPKPVEEPRDYGWGITTAFQRGFERLRSLPDVAQGDYEELAQHFEAMEQYDLSPEDQQRMKELQDTEGWWDAFAYYMKNPSLIAQIVAESLPMSLAPIAGGIGLGMAGTAVAGPVGTVVGTMTGAAAGSFLTEYLNAISEYFGRQGIDSKNAEELKKAFADPQLMSEARIFGKDRGIPIAIFDALSFGLAGRIYRPTAALVKGAAGKTLGMAGEIVMQAGAGMAGEAGAQKVSVGYIEDIPGVLAEGFGEIVPGFVEQAASSLMRPNIESTEEDDLSRQLREDLTNEEYAEMEAAGQDPLGMQTTEARGRVEQERYLAEVALEAEREIQQEVEAIIREDEVRSAAFVQMETDRDARLEAQRQAAEYQREVQRGEEVKEFAPHEAPEAAPKITVKPPTEQVTAEPAVGSAVAEAMVEAKKKKAAREEKKAAKKKEKLEAVGVEIEAEPLVAPEKPVTPRPTKVISYARDSFLVTRAKSPVNRRLSMEKFEAEGLDIASMREKVYGGKPAFSRHPDALGPDDVAEILNEGNYPSPTGEPWTANTALDAITEEVEGRKKLYTSTGADIAAQEEMFVEEMGAFEAAAVRRELIGPPTVHEITVDGTEARVSEDPEGEITISIEGVPDTITTRKKGETNADLVRAVLAEQGEVEAREERAAIQAEEPLAEEVEPEIPDFEELKTEAEEAATSPTNELVQPTAAQKEAGNYKKGHVSIAGLPITIENPKGSSRLGFRMKDHYGYIKRTEGVDGDQVDVFVNPRIEQLERVWVIDQVKEDGTTFDEHKVMLGYTNQLDAVRAYKRNYEKGWKVGPITEMSLAEFKTWLQTDAKTAVQPAKPERRARKFVRTKKGLRFSLPRARKALQADAREQVPGATPTWVEEVVGEPAELTTEELIDEMVTEEAAPMTKAEVETAIAPLIEELPVLDIQVHESLETLPKGDLKERITEKGGPQPSGVYDIVNDTIHLFADRHRSADQAMKTAIHEGVTHKGLRFLFSEKLPSGLVAVNRKKFNILMMDVYNNAIDRKRIKKLETKYAAGETLTTGDKLRVGEEYIASMSEANERPGLFKRVYAAIRKQLRRIGLVKDWTDNDINSLLAESRSSLKKAGIEGITLTEEVQVEETGEIFDVETDAGIILDQHDKRVGIIEKLRACL